MSNARLSLSMTVGGKSISGQVSRDDEASEVQEVELAVGIAGTLTTRTDANTGVITVASGHGIVDTDTLVVSWVGGAQRVVDVTATTSTTISIDAGTGTDLPVTTTAVVISKSTITAVGVGANNLKALAIYAKQRIHCAIRDAGGSVLLNLDIPAGEGYFWITGAGFANPVSTNAIGSVALNNCSTVADTVSIGVLKNTV